MEIRRSLGRFLSIFFIVAIGCAFFSGIRASEPDMRYSGDEYFDNKNMMDIQVISTMGLSEEDLSAIKAVDGIEYAEGGYSSDVLCTDGANQVVVHVMSMLPTMNQVQLEDGRLPEAEDECALDVDYLAESNLEIGDTVTFSSGTEDDIADTLVTDTFTITGAVSSPNYISFQRGSATIGNGSVSAFAYVPEEAFSLDVYTEICARVEGAAELTAFTDKYDDRVAEVLENVEAIKEERQEARYEEVVEEAETALNDAEQEVADAEAELEKGRAEAETELADGRAQLEDAQAELDSGKSQLETSRAQIESNRQQLIDSQAEVDQGTEELNANIDTLNAQIDQLNAAKEQYNALAASGKTDDVTLAALQALYEQIQSGETAIAQAQAQIDAAKAQLSTAQEQINSGWVQLEAGEQQLADAEAELTSGEQELADGWKSITRARRKQRQSLRTENSRSKTQSRNLQMRRKKYRIWICRNGMYMTEAISRLYGIWRKCGQNAGYREVFPVIFFLVAALISLTTMTRMVGEQRTLIGTFKALGYERHSIAGKYIGYALLATVSGSVAGILFGEKVFPYIIINAYGIMYQHMNELAIPYNIQYGLGAAGAALASTLIATFLACFKELKEQAAELMRPPTPKQGQRVLLERVGFIWKHLNFRGRQVFEI